MSADSTPAAPWTGKKFTCARCQGEWQLEAADKCVDTGAITKRSVSVFYVPVCATPGCAYALNTVEIESRAEEEAQFPS